MGTGPSGGGGDAVPGQRARGKVTAAAGSEVRRAAGSRVAAGCPPAGLISVRFILNFLFFFLKFFYQEP